MLNYEYFLNSKNLKYDLSIVWQDLKKNLKYGENSQNKFKKNSKGQSKKT